MSSVLGADAKTSGQRASRLPANLGDPTDRPHGSSHGGTSDWNGRRAIAGRQSPTVELFLQLCRLSDTAVALSALLVLFVIANLGRLPSGLDDFLGVRLSVKNCLLLVVFSACWYLSCRWAGLYDWARVKRRQSEVLRVCVAASGGTLVAVIFPLTSQSGAFRIDLLLPFFELGTAL